jgi:pimeloyl-ACP methyl ester carboxylesterase
MCSLEASVRAHHMKRLVLYEPPLPTGTPLNPPGLVARLQKLLDAGDRDGVVATFMTEVPRVPPAQLAVMRGLPAWQARVSAAHTIVRELRVSDTYTFDPARVKDVRTPTLLLLGGASPTFFATALDVVRHALTNTRLVVLPDQTHVAIDTAPEQFAREVLAFLG